MNDETNTWEEDPFAAAYPETETFWREAANGKLMLKHCTSCENAHWYPRPVCPLCGSDQVKCI